MISGEYTVTIRCPIDDVFDHIADGTRNSTWRGPIVEVALAAGNGTLGSVWHQLVRGTGGRVAEADYRVTAFERPHRYAFELIAGPALGGGGYTLAEVAPAMTAVTIALTLRPRGVLPGLSGLVRRHMAAELDSLDRLRELLETAPPDSS
jgi:uncharacterized protein YndB with AHSA1/START domain